MPFALRKIGTEVYPSIEGGLAQVLGSVPRPVPVLRIRSLTHGYARYGETERALIVFCGSGVRQAELTHPTVKSSNDDEKCFPITSRAASWNSLAYSAPANGSAAFP